MVALRLRDDGKVSSDPQLSDLQMASDYAPSGTASGALRHFYHPTYPLAVVADSNPGDGCSIHLDPGHSGVAILVYPPVNLPTTLVWGRLGDFVLSVPVGGALPPLAGPLHARRAARPRPRPGMSSAQPRSAAARPWSCPAPARRWCRCVLRRVDEGGPWPLTRVLTALGAFDVERVGVARALGDRRGIPLVHSQELRWHDHALFLEARHGRDGVDELSLELPPWDELVGGAGRQTRCGS